MDDVTSGKLRVLELYSGIGGMHCALEGEPPYRDEP